MNADTTLKSSTLSQKQNAQPLRPAGWLESIALFGIPAFAIVLSFYGFRPWLESLGYSELTSYLASLCVPLALMFTAALVAYNKVEGRPFTRAAFAERMRYPRLRWSDLFWGLGIFVLGGLGFGLGGWITTLLIDAHLLPLPAHLPSMADPKVVFSMDMLNQTAGGQIKGQWGTALLVIVTYFFNIIGEELWWRGYILPRQEATFGKYTWVIHGVLWACFHTFKYWDIFGLLPVCLLIAYISTRLKRNWPGLIGHGLVNGGLLMIVLATF